MVWGTVRTESDGTLAVHEHFHVAVSISHDQLLFVVVVIGVRFVIGQHGTALAFHLYLICLSLTSLWL